jgi:sodium/potassium-transporting ATPase subunit alpha
MKIHRLSVDEALASVAASANGLSLAEAQRRLREFGPNRIDKVGRRPPLYRLIAELTRFFSLILWIAAALALMADWYEPGQGMAQVAYAVIAVIVISSLFSFWQEHRIEQTLAALQKFLPRKVQVLRGGTLLEVPAEDLVVGDVVLLKEGDSVPADCRAIETVRTRVNTATLTGESVSRALNAAASEEDDPVLSRNILLAGTSVASGHCKAIVFATASQTQFGRIARLAQSGSTVPSPLRQQLAQLSRLIAALSVTIGISFFCIGAAIGVPIWQDLIFSIGLIVAMVPEGLLPTLTLALVLAAQRLARRNVLVRDLTSVETLGCVTVICSDKTGTLTENRMRVRDLLIRGRRYSAAGLIEHASSAGDNRDFFLVAALCHDVKEATCSGQSVRIGDPMEVALVEMAERALPAPVISRRLDELPFDTDRRRQTVLQDTARGTLVCCKGALEAVLPLCTELAADGAVRPLDTAMRQAISQVEAEMAASGLRVLAFASKPASAACRGHGLEQDLILQGLAGLEDPPRAEVREAVTKCRTAGIKVIVVTGDHPLTATAIAREIGLVQTASPVVITGTQLQRLSEVGLRTALDAEEIIFARVTPEQKMRIVEALIAKKQVVAATGDGVNDAPALRAAHIGIAMGRTGTDVAREAANMVLVDDNFASIVNAVEEGRAVFQNIRKFLTYVLVHNVAELVPYLAFALFRIPLPLTPIQILFVDMGTDSLTALGLGVERPDPQGMRLPPRPVQEKLLNLPLALRAYLFLGAIEAAAAMAAFFFVLLQGGWSYGNALPASDALYRQATTACLTAIIVLQIVNVLLCRSSVRSVFSMPLLDNRLILAGIALELVLLLIALYMPLAHAVLGTEVIPAAAWPLLLVLAVAMLLLEELRKWIVRRSLRRDA